VDSGLNPNTSSKAQFAFTSQTEKLRKVEIRQGVGGFSSLPSKNQPLLAYLAEKLISSYPPNEFI
jgi:hypothetical protein